MTLLDALRSAVRRAAPRSPAGSRERVAPPLPEGSPAPTVAGVSPDGSPKTVDPKTFDPTTFDAGGRTLTLLFMTSECQECKQAWSALESMPEATFVLTPGPETESRRRVVQLAGNAQGLVLMSGAAWHSYGITKAPWVVEIENGTIVKTEPLRTLPFRGEIT